MLDRCTADTKIMGASLDYYIQQNFQSPLMEKTRYSMTKPDLNNMYPQTQPYRKYQKENPNPRKLTAPTKIQATDDPPPSKPKEDKH